jgi:geranylgeranyl pyrophosphate synthase
VLAILERCGARDHAAGEAQRYRELALTTIRNLPIPEDRREELASVVERSIAI